VKKLLFAVLLLLTAASAEARQVTTDLLVVRLKSQKAAGATAGVADLLQGEWVHENVKAILNEWKVDHVVYDGHMLPTGKNEWLRTGRVVVGPDTITASAVLHERSSSRSASFDYPAYRPDSMWITRVVNGTPTLPSVPQLFLLEPGPAGAHPDLAAMAWRRTTACSIGTSNNTTAIMGGSGVSHECEGCIYSPYADNVFYSFTGTTVAELDLATVGGVLPLLGVYVNPLPTTMQELGRMPADLMKARAIDGVVDTTGFFEAGAAPFRWTRPESAMVWKRLNTGWNVLDADGATVAAAQMVFVNSVLTMASDADPNHRNGDSFEHSALFVGLAALDSLLGGDLLNNRKTMAVTVDGAFARCSQWNSAGVYLPDSAAVKATVDSLVAYGIPFLVGVNIDSVAAYPYEVAWWNKAGARFTPQVWSGVHGANGGASYTASKYTLRDILGHARTRQAYGPADGEAADTSVYAQLRYAFARCDSIFGTRSSRFLLPPLDDYVPTNTTLADSVLIAARLAGATGVRIAGQDTLRRSLQTTNVQGDYFGGLKLRAHTGEYVTGGSRIMAVPGGTDFVGSGFFVEDSGYAYQPFCLIAERQLTGLVRGKWHGYETSSGMQSQFQTTGSSANRNVPSAGEDAGGPDANRYHNGWTMASRASILKVAASTLGGTTYVADLKQPGAWGSTGNPTRPGWWAIRASDGFRRVVNAVAGRTLISWGYPENIEK
jgi:hypothetical protein